jgi:hypothetical protein
MTDDDALLADLEKAERANVFARDCQVCEALDRMSERAKPQVETALRGTIGARKLAELLTRNGYPTGRRAVENHRREDHA